MKTIEHLFDELMETKEEALFYSYLLNNTLLEVILGGRPPLIAKEMGIQGSLFDYLTDDALDIFVGIKSSIARDVDIASTQGMLDFDKVIDIAKHIATKRVETILKYRESLATLVNVTEDARAFVWIRTETKSYLLTKGG